MKQQTCFYVGASVHVGCLEEPEVKNELDGIEQMDSFLFRDGAVSCLIIGILFDILRQTIRLGQVGACATRHVEGRKCADAPEEEFNGFASSN